MLRKGDWRKETVSACFNLRYQHASEVRTDLQRWRRDTDSARMPAASAEAPSRTGMLWKVTIPVALTTALLALASYLYLHRSPKLAEKDTIVLADFANRTGDAVFDDTLRSFSRHLLTIRSKSPGTFRFNRCSGTGARLRIASKITAVLSPLNGSLPLAIS